MWYMPVRTKSIYIIYIVDGDLYTVAQVRLSDEWQLC